MQNCRILNPSNLENIWLWNNGFSSVEMRIIFPRHAHVSLSEIQRRRWGREQIVTKYPVKSEQELHTLGVYSRCNEEGIITAAVTLQGTAFGCISPDDRQEHNLKATKCITSPCWRETPDKAISSTVAVPLSQAYSYRTDNPKECTKILR